MNMAQPPAPPNAPATPQPLMGASVPNDVSSHIEDLADTHTMEQLKQKNRIAPSTYNEIIIPGEDAKSGTNNWATDFPEALFDFSSDVRELDNRLNDNLEKAAFLKRQLAVFQKELEQEARPIGEVFKE